DVRAGAVLERHRDRLVWSLDSGLVQYLREGVPAVERVRAAGDAPGDSEAAVSVGLDQVPGERLRLGPVVDADGRDALLRVLGDEDQRAAGEPELGQHAGGERPAHYGKAIHPAREGEDLILRVW